MSEWATPDGLDPPGEQLAFPWDEEPLRAAITEVIVHRVIWGPRSWSCSCGAGKDWPTTAPMGRPSGAARSHMKGVRKRVGA